MISRARASLIAISVPAFSFLLAACAGQMPGLFGEPAPVTAPGPEIAPPPANIAAADLVGNWGLASYHNEGDRPRTETAARGQCTKPYVIGRGPTGGVVMHLADAPQPRELRLKGGPAGKAYIGPEGPAGDMQDREILSFDGRVLVTRFLDPEVGGRYGTMVYVRCGAPGTRPAPTAKSPKAPKKQA
jgi:hypothetical protein